VKKNKTLQHYDLLPEARVNLDFIFIKPNLNTILEYSQKKYFSLSNIYCYCNNLEEIYDYNLSMKTLRNFYSTNSYMILYNGRYEFDIYYTKLP
jgi:hypothetical protein